MKPLKSAIDDNSDFTAFALSEPNPETNQYCLSYPCASAYLNGRHIRSTISDLSPIDFQFWVSHTISEPHFDIVHPEELRRLIHLPGVHVLAVEVDKRPTWVPRDQVLFHVPRKMLKTFGMRADQGIYIFRNVDREFFKIESWDQSVMKSKLFDIGVDNLKETKHIGIAIVDRESIEGDRMKVVAMNELASKYNKKEIMFTTVEGTAASHISQVLRFGHICGPLFLVINTEDPTGERYGMTEVNSEYTAMEIKGFIDSSLNGSRKAVIGQDTRGIKFKGGVNELSVVDFERRIFNKEHSNIVCFTSSCQNLPDEYVTVMVEAARIYNGTGVKFWAFDQGRNDAPEGVEKFTEYPQILLFKDHSKQYKVFNKAFTLPNFEKFIRVNTGIEISEEQKLELQNKVLDRLNNNMESYNRNQYTEEL